MDVARSDGKFRRSEERNAYLDGQGSSSSSSSSFRSAGAEGSHARDGLEGAALADEWNPSVSASAQRRSQYVEAVNQQWSQQVQAEAASTTAAAATVGPQSSDEPRPFLLSRNARELFKEDDSVHSPASARADPPDVLASPHAEPAPVPDAAALSQMDQLRKVLAQAKAELAQERMDRLKAENDLADVLFQSQQVSAQVSREGQPARHTDPEGGLDGVRLSVGERGSDALWESVRAREERARQRVRKEFIEQAQDRLTKEQRRREEAEAVVADALRRADVADTAQLAAQEKWQHALQQLEAAKAELHERYLLIEELRSQLARLERQLEQQAHHHQREEEKHRAEISALETLAQQRGATLEAQREFTARIRQELGLKDMDLLNKDSLYEDVLARVSALQDQAAHEQERLDRQLQDMEDTYQLRHDEQQVELESLRRRCEELQRRANASQSLSKADFLRLEATAQSATEERDRAQGQMLELQVENKSLRLQLEKLTTYAKQLSSERAESTAQHRVERENLLRRYESENKALRAQLATAHESLKTENEKHIQQVLELSEELTRFRDENTRLSHRLNVLSHDRSEATRQLSVAHEAVQKLHSEREHLSHSLAYLRDRSYEEEDLQDALDGGAGSAHAGVSGSAMDHSSLVLTPTRRQPGRKAISPRARASFGSPTPVQSARALSILTEGTAALHTPSQQSRRLTGGLSPRASGTAALGEGLHMAPRGAAAGTEPSVRRSSRLESGLVLGAEDIIARRRSGSVSSQFRTPALQVSTATAPGNQSTMPQEAVGQPAPIPLPRRSPMRTRYSGEKNIGTMSGVGASRASSRINSPRRSLVEGGYTPAEAARDARLSVQARDEAGVGDSLFGNVELVRTSGSGPHEVDFLWRANPTGGATQASPLPDVGKLSTPPRAGRHSRRQPSEDHFA